MDLAELAGRLASFIPIATGLSVPFLPWPLSWLAGICAAAGFIAYTVAFTSYVIAKLRGRPPEDA